MRLGIDIGSTTVKLAVIDEVGDILFSDYRRHLSNISGALLEMVGEAKKQLGNIRATAMITGSGGLSLANWVGVDFLQEVVAVSEAIGRYIPETDVAIEIGGEDAKIIYFTGGLEQRMNGICAGGTGSFIDQMASLLQTDASGLNELAKRHQTIYPIAARCGVFAKSDLQPLINEGTPKADLAVSIYQAIVTQTISGLAQGKPIKGRVAFLGGPLHYMDALRQRFIDTLHPEEAIVPDNSHLFAALGCALSSQNSITLEQLLENLSQKKTTNFEIDRMEPLFHNRAEYDAFMARHEAKSVPKKSLQTYEGDVFLGIDAGSTTTKLVLIGEGGELLHSHYGSNEGNPLQMATKGLLDIYEKLPPSATIKQACVTGYGEGLIQAGLKIDHGEIETMAHYRAAAHFAPDVDFILDIGGQDMKFMRIKDGLISSVLLNEACSAGCGSFIETFAKSLGKEIAPFAQEALFAKNPVDLGSRCTVFMNSRVKQAQKEGAEVADISAGLAYSVIKNALQKVIKITDPAQYGQHIVVQGGTFYNEAVLRAFEKISGREAVRPDIAGLMGAYGAALIAKEKYEALKQPTTLISQQDIAKQQVTITQTRCPACSNKCLLTINHFGEDRKFVSGNRCDVGARIGLGEKPVKNESGIPNLFEQKYKRLFSYKPLSPEDAPRGIVGIPRVLNMYENYPLWFTFFTELGYAVKLSPRSSRAVYEKGMDSIPSESQCYPAKLVHGHIEMLIKQGVPYIFYPGITHERQLVEGADNTYNCPMVTSYSENIKNNVDSLAEAHVRFHNPFLTLNNYNRLRGRLVEEFSHLPKREVELALAEAWREQERYRYEVREMGEAALAYMEKHQIQGLVLASRPYHIDPAIHHGIPDMINSYQVAVLTDDSVAHLAAVPRPLNVRDQWAYHSRMYAGAAFVAIRDDLELVQLTSFGCGLDAVTSEEIEGLLAKAGKTYTLLKIDEVSNLGSIRIRLRSLFAALGARKSSCQTLPVPELKVTRPIFTKEMKTTHTILCPQMSPIHFDMIQAAFNSEGYRLEVMPAFERGAVETGLKYVNNDACYPALIVVGQILGALNSGRYDLEKVAVMMTQTGGGCRASNYIAFIRKALQKAGLGHVPVISLNPSGMEQNPGFALTPKLLNKAVQAILYGDALMRVLHRTRPYEQTPGSANALYDKWRGICKESLGKGMGLGEYKSNISGLVAAFDGLPLIHASKPRVGIVGEILVKFHPTANNDIIHLLESEGAETVVPDLIDFLLYTAHNHNFNHRYLGGSLKSKWVANALIEAIELYRKPLRNALEKSGRFNVPATIKELGDMAEPLVSLGNQTGEGWFLAAEMVELIQTGVPNIICAQPFACLPNHIVGKGILKKLKAQYPGANVVAVDYDPGASEANQLNRIKLMLSAAQRNLSNQPKGISLDVVTGEERGTVLGEQGVPTH